MISAYDLVLFHGPPCVGKTLYYYENLAVTHTRICPRKIFKEHPSYGIRQVVFKVIDILRQGRKVTIDDENLYLHTRRSYIKLVKAKVPNCRIVCICFRPRHGPSQLQWSREIGAAEQWLHLLSVYPRFESGTLSNEAVTDEDAPDQPQENEGFDVIEQTTVLTAQAHFKLELAGLFIQFEALVLLREGKLTLPLGAVEACGLWYGCNPCGRIVLMCHSHNSTSKYERSNQIRAILKKLTDQLDKCPVYAVSVDDPLTSGMFTEAPHPGLIAFVQRLHHVDIHHSGSVYLFQSDRHKQSAVAAGMSHDQASKIFSNPNLVKTPHVFSKSVKPAFLVDLEVNNVKNDTKEESATVPLFMNSSESSDCVCCCDLGNGRSMYMAFKDHEVLNNYQTLYHDNASRVSDTTRKIAELYQQLTMRSEKQSTSTQRKQVVTLNRQTIKNLPKWMQPKKRASKSIMKNCDSGDAKSEKSGGDMTSTLVSIPSSLDVGLIEKKPILKPSLSCTVYLMTEEELVDTAKLVLQQAGLPLPSAVTETDDMDSVQPVNKGQNDQIIDRNDDDAETASVSAGNQQQTEEANNQNIEPQEGSTSNQVVIKDQNCEMSELDALFAGKASASQRKGPPKRRKRVRHCSDDHRSLDNSSSADDLSSDERNTIATAADSNSTRKRQTKDAPKHKHKSKFDVTSTLLDEIF